MKGRSQIWKSVQTFPNDDGTELCRISPFPRKDCLPFIEFRPGDLLLTKKEVEDLVCILDELMGRGRILDMSITYMEHGDLHLNPNPSYLKLYNLMKRGKFDGKEESISKES